MKLQELQQLDRDDPLRNYRSLFHLPEGVIYLDGNSLGPAPKEVFKKMEKVLHQEWAEDLIRSWNNAGWWELTDRLGSMVAKLIGADDNEVVVCDTTSVNLHKVLHAALSLKPGRSKVIAEADCFPSDLYVLEGVKSLRPDLEILLEGRDGSSIPEMLDEQVAAVLINHVDYRSGIIRDMENLTRQVQEFGGLAVWDLSHSAGIFPVQLNRCRVDFAVGCTYKYLNGGPGAPAYLYAASRHHAACNQPLSGWFGHARPFDFERHFDPDSGIRRFVCGTQPILSLRALQSGLEIYQDVSLQQVREKSMALTDLFIKLLKNECAAWELEIISPEDASQRGSQVAVSHPEGYAVMQALISRGVIGDFRAPNLMRFGFAPLFLSYQDIHDAVKQLKQILESKEWNQEAFLQKSKVT
ncbi:MAG: kynureninase [Deltaproteobacteria bacterium]